MIDMVTCAAPRRKGILNSGIHHLFCCLHSDLASRRYVERECTHYHFMGFGAAICDGRVGLAERLHLDVRMRVGGGHRD